jgi:hypothetical protein
LPEPAQPSEKQAKFLKRRFAREDAKRGRSEKEQEKKRQDLVFAIDLSSKWQEAISICPKRTRFWLDDNMHLLEEAEAELREAEKEAAD